MMRYLLLSSVGGVLLVPTALAQGPAEESGPSGWGNPYDDGSPDTAAPAPAPDTAGTIEGATPEGVAGSSEGDGSETDYVEDGYEDDEDLEEEFEPDEALQEFVSVSTKFTYPVQQTPASVYVVTREQIEAAGYTSVGEALAWVPGVFVSYDLINYHAGARGLFGGSRSGSRLFRILINGRHVAFVQAETYLLGPEFIPISAVERIEVMLGPASALYGAGALVGAINVVTRRPAYEGRVRVGGEARGRGSVGGQRSVGLDGSLWATGSSWFLIGGVVGQWENRSGLAVPDGPFASNYAGRQSEQDIAFPRGGLVRGEMRALGGRLAVQGLLQEADRTAEFYDVSVLSHRTRIDLRNANLALTWDRSFSRGWYFRAKAGYASASNGGNDVHDPDPSDDLVHYRDFLTTEWSGSIEILREFGGRGLMLWGVDGRYTFDQPQRIDEQLGSTITRGATPDTRSIYTIAAYTQLLYPVSSIVSLAAAARYDYHSVIQHAFSGRAAMVLRLDEQLSLKLMGGRSFKAPSPEQLYNNPLSNLDIQGDPELPAQYLNGVSIVADWFPSRRLRLAGTFYYNDTTDALAYLARGGQLRATAFDARTVGGELMIRYAKTSEEGPSYGFGASTSLQDTRTGERFQGGVLEKDVPDNAAFPQAMVTAFGRLRFPSIMTGFYAGWRFVSSRVPSQSNLRAQGTTDMRFPGYKLPAYHMVRLAATVGPLDLSGDAKLNLRLTLDDALNSRPVAIGFNGIDVPGIGRTLWASAELSF